ncbi:MAG TPA: hypothetical protein VLU25_10135 [Acidobacteriota bacterium]|nr:hypothetical protein [Acidobacteriota bacterium]
MLVQVSDGSNQVHLVEAHSGQWYKLGTKEYLKQGRFWIPLKRRNELRFFLDSLYFPHSFPEFLRKSLACRMPEAAGGPERVLKKGRVRTLDDILGPQLMEAAGEALDTRSLFGRRLNSIIIAEDRGALSPQARTLFLFEGGEKPFAVVKACPRGQDCCRLLRQEFEAVQRLNAHLPSGAKSLLPPRSMYVEGEDFAFLAEPFQAGRSMYFQLRSTWSRRKLAGTHFSTALDWLVRFQKASWVEDARVQQDEVGERIGAALLHLRQVRMSAPERAMIEHLGHLAWELRSERIPLTAAHGDFWVRNVLLDEGRAKVVGWQDFKTRALPFADLFLFAVSYGLSFPWKRGQWAHPRPAFRTTLLERSWLSEHVERFLLGYCQKMNLPPRLLDLFLPLFLAEQMIEQRQEGGEFHVWRELFRDYAEQGGCVFLE